MKPLFYSIATLLFLVSCEKDPDPITDVSAGRITRFKEHINYEGSIKFCDTLPPSYIPAIASTIFLDSNTVLFHLSADSISFDTTLAYDFQTSIFEEASLSISFLGPTEEDGGWFSHGYFGMDLAGYIHIEFGNTNCLTNAVFDGYSKH